MFIRIVKSIRFLIGGINKMKPHYFNQEIPDSDDILLKMAISQGYVPASCLLAGEIVFGLVQKGKDPCAGCNGPRGKCNGRPKNNERL